MIRQVSVFLENKSGRMARITTALGKESVNIRAMSLADASDFGILRLVLSDTTRGVEILKKQGFTVRVTDVIAVGIEDYAGALGELLTTIENADLNLEYVYMLNNKTPDHAVFIFRFDNPDKALAVLNEKGLAVLGEDFVLGNVPFP